MKRKSITASSEIVTTIAELTRMNFDLLTKLVPWLGAHEKAQQKFRAAVICELSRIRSETSMLLVGQMAQTPGRPFYCKEKLEQDAQALEEFLSKQASKRSMAIAKLLERESPPVVERHDRRRRWWGWEI